MGQDVVEDRDQVGGGLARAGLGLGHHVTPVEGDGQDSILDLGEALEAELVNSSAQLLRQVELVERDAEIGLRQGRQEGGEGGGELLRGLSRQL